MELTIGRSEWVWRLAPESDMGTLYALEELIIQPAVDPEVIVFGTSRARGAFLPTEMERAGGMKSGQVLNLAMGGTHIFDALITYERNRAALRGAKSAIIQVDPFQFSTGRKPPGRFRELASWHDRMAYDGLERLGLIRDIVFRTDSVLPFVHYIVKWTILDGHLPEPFGIDKYGRLSAVIIANDHDEGQFTSEAFTYWLDWQYPTYEYAPIFEEQLLKLVRMLREDGVRPYVIQMPTPGDFPDMLRDRPGDPQGHFESRMTELAAKERFRVQVWTRPAEVGLTDRDYRDWGHLNTAGAEKWSVSFATWLRDQERLAPTAPVSAGDRAGAR